MTFKKPTLRGTKETYSKFEYIKNIGCNNDKFSSQEVWQIDWKKYRCSVFPNRVGIGSIAAFCNDYVCGFRHMHTWPVSSVYWHTPHHVSFGFTRPITTSVVIEFKFTNLFLWRFVCGHGFVLKMLWISVFFLFSLVYKI